METSNNMDQPAMGIKASGLIKTDTRMIKRTQPTSQDLLKLLVSKTSNLEVVGTVESQMVTMEEEAIARPLKDRGAGPDPTTRDILDVLNDLDEIVVGVDLERTVERMHIANVQRVLRLGEDVTNHGLNTVKKRDDANHPPIVEMTIVTTMEYGGLALALVKRSRVMLRTYTTSIVE